MNPAEFPLLDSAAAERIAAVAEVWRRMPQPKPLPPQLFAGLQRESEKFARNVEVLAKAWQAPAYPPLISLTDRSK